MKSSKLAAVIAVCLAPFNCAFAGHSWRGVHVWVDSDSHARQLIGVLPELAADGANVVVVEVDYSYEFSSHPELRNRRFVTRATAREMAETARHSGIRLIPEFNCLGHQSYGRRIGPLLQKYPVFNETPFAHPDDTNIYCLSWCPLAPGINRTVFSLIDDIAAGFAAEAIHVGMDEVYLIASPECPRCRGKDPAQLYAAQVRALYDHIVRQRHWQMLMWADRLVGPRFQGWSRFDRPDNDLSAAIDLIPKDIILCDWHYEWKKSYPSVAYLASKGFRVWPTGFRPLAATEEFSNFALAQKSPRVLGYLCTTWTSTSITNMPAWPPIRDILLQWRNSGPCSLEEK